uniref:Cation/H+ exchanger transmembrane domain-containing protein n=1 Tax=Leersia perrieri TaxID=77586 RepID=A0A0D9WFZ0_9ORYZ
MVVAAAENTTSPAALGSVSGNVKMASDGMWQGENPLDFALPLLAVQGGILLGPSALGRWAAFRRTIFPAWSAAALDTISGLGLLLFLFLVGLELDFRSVRRVGPRSIAIAAAGIIPPFLAAAGLVPLLDAAVPTASRSHHASFLSLCVFVGAALSVTALPVLACILKELELLGLPFGDTAMAAAAVNDVFAWALLALALAVSGGGNGVSHPPLAPVYILTSGAAFVAFVLGALRPLMSRLVSRSRRVDVDVAAVVACALLAGAATDAIGVHPVFGAFVFALAVPREGGFAERAGEKVSPLVSGLMLPLYFATSGLRTDVDSVRGAAAWGMVALVVAVAIGGKFAGTFAVAAATGMARREAAALGVAMSAKGLVELIVLNIGKERKVLDDTKFAIFVIMALTTTVVATPLMTAIYRRTPTETSPEGDFELKDGDVCPA